MSATLATRPTLPKVTPADLPLIQQLNAEDRLIDFMALMWRAVEPSRPFVRGWVIDAICEHLEGVTRGEISRLIINVPPGMAKSLTTNVFWPAWEWIQKPALRYVTASYSSSLTERDNLRTSQLIQSPEYRAMWGDRFTATASMVKILTSKTGWKLATSVGGVGTGERGDRVICLPFDGMILTDRGWLKIGEVVRERLKVRVAGWSGVRVEWQQIAEYETNPAGALVEIDYGVGCIRCTDDHPVWVAGRGYVSAGDVCLGDRIGMFVAEPETVRTVRDDLPRPPRAHEGSPLLLAGLPRSVANKHGAGEQQPAVPDLWEDGLSAASPLSACAEGAVLQSCLPWSRQPWGGQPCVSDRPTYAGMQGMLEIVSDGPKPRAGTEVLFEAVRGDCAVARSPEAVEGNLLRGVQERVQAGQSQEHILLNGMQERCAFQADERERQRALSPWRGRAPVSGRLDENPQGAHQGEGWQSLPCLFDDAGRSREASVRSPHRLREGELGAAQSDHGLPVVPRKNARQAAEPGTMALATVRYVRRLDEVPDLTFNVRVAPYHNYFADGILVHNCDDPNSVKQVESKTIRDSTNQWLTEVLPTRLNDPRTSAIVLIQQRTHEEDATGTLLKDDSDYVHLMIPMQFDGRRYETAIGWTDPRTIEDIDPKRNDRQWWEVKGELAFPARFPAWVVERDQKAMGSYAVAGQFQQAPAPRGGGIIKDEWWQQWGPDDPRGLRFPPFDLVVAFYDGAYTTKEQNDPSALAVLGTFTATDTAMPKVMLARCWSERLALHDAVVKIDETCRKYRVSMLLVENKANGISVVQELHRLFVEKPYSVVLVDPGHRNADKVARTMSVVPLFEDEMVYCPNTEWARSARDEFIVFPRGSHDDQVDAIVGGLRWLRDNGMLRRVEEVMSQERDRMIAEDDRGRQEPLYRT